MSHITANDIVAMKQRGEKIAVVTAYDASFTVHLERADVDVILVGDSLGMVLQGHDTTLPVTIEHMAYHTELVARARHHALLVVDMPYQSYRDPQTALDNAQRLLEAGADMVKLEGGQEIMEVIQHLRHHDIAICGHLGLLPQSVKELGGYKVQGREQHAAQKMLTDARALQAAGVQMIVLECIPRKLAAEISAALTIPTIGIGAGPACDGQVLVIYDLLGITVGKRPKFSKDFLSEQPRGKSITDAIAQFVNEVKAGTFPDDSHSFE